MRSDSSPSDRALAALRIGVGVFFLVFGQYKVFGTGFTLGGGFTGYITRWLQSGTYPFMKPVLTGLVLPHATPVAFLVAYGELAIGLALVLGILARTASAFGLLFMLTMLFSSAYPGPASPFWEYFGASLDQSVFAMCFAAFLMAGPPRVWTVTKLLQRRRPRPHLLRMAADTQPPDNDTTA